MYSFFSGWTEFPASFPYVLFNVFIILCYNRVLFTCTYFKRFHLFIHNVLLFHVITTYLLYNVRPVLRGPVCDSPYAWLQPGVQGQAAQGADETQVCSTEQRIENPISFEVFNCAIYVFSFLASGLQTLVLVKEL